MEKYKISRFFWNWRREQFTPILLRSYTSLSILGLRAFYLLLTAMGWQSNNSQKSIKFIIEILSHEWD